jgi:5-methylcytosine-specific restriction endonuclease McrA
MPYVNVHVDASDVISELSEDELATALAEKRSKASPMQGYSDDELLQQVYWHFREQGNAPQCLRDYFWQRLGKYL